MPWFLDNTSPLVFILLSSADSPALRMSPRLIVTVVRHLHAQGARIAHHPLSKLWARQEARNCPPRGQKPQRCFSGSLAEVEINLGMNGDAPAFMQFSVRLKKNRFTVSGSTVHGWKRMKRSKGTPLGGSEGRCCFVALTSGDIL